MLRRLEATRYVTPLREGGSLPAIVEAADSGLYVLKFRGAGQGPLALVAEVVAGEIGRILGLRVPELVLMEVDPVLGRSEPDEEIQDLLKASAGLNLGMDYLPGSMMFDAAARQVAEVEVASKAVWFDALVMNVDRTARNANLLWWHRELYFIDHGAALYWQHNWPLSEEEWERFTASRFAAVKDHVLLRWAGRLREVDAELRALLTRERLTGVLELVPEEWLAVERRAGYVEFLARRVEASASFVEEAENARALLV
jgi:hypothetical protein